MQFLLDKKNLYKVKNYFLVKSTYFHIFFFCESGQGWPSLTDSNSLSSIIESILRNKLLLFNGSQVISQHLTRSRVFKVAYGAQLLLRVQPVGIPQRTPNRPISFARSSFHSRCLELSFLKIYTRNICLMNSTRLNTVHNGFCRFCSNTNLFVNVSDLV